MGKNQAGEINRRALLKKGAVAGGIVWAAPMILSDTAGAISQTTGSGPRCTKFYWGKYATVENTTSITGDCSGSASHCYNAASGNSPDGPAYVPGRTYESACGSVVSASGQTIVLHKHHNKDTTQPVILSVSGYTKGGSGANSCGAATVTQDPTTGYWTIVFPARAPNGGGFSHIEFGYCT